LSLCACFLRSQIFIL